VNAPRAIDTEPALLPVIRLRWNRGRCLSTRHEMAMARERLRGVDAWWAQQMRTRLLVAMTEERVNG
jgi:hypothetical protein